MKDCYLAHDELDQFVLKHGSKQKKMTKKWELEAAKKQEESHMTLQDWNDEIHLEWDTQLKWTDGTSIVYGELS